ncbi:hypothetical protein [Plantactinospora sp. KLBMP9567]|uniref:hypothetical protein n=1 Tax=Plantactinospora sp. KLBMP9567 TaxID=3085900 RepID=UPI002980CB63|nr:hypothetical protein [Plantactinospora sp. KLBMP9567]MDW5323017.1 hypothetical protein [Plantactinospora sp. KLBMP9567]
MDEMRELRAMRADIPVPGPAQLASAETRLTAAMASASLIGAGRAAGAGAWRRWLPRPAVRVAVATAAVAVVAVGATLAGLVGEAGPGEGGGGTTVAEQLPKLQLAAAARATGRTSFAFKVWDQENDRVRPLYEGAYDPVGKRGFVAMVNQHGNRFERRVVGDHTYTIRIVDGKTVDVRKETDSAPIGFGPLPDGVTTDPAEILNALAEAGTVDKTGSTGGVETYTFQYELPRVTPAPTQVRPRTGSRSNLTVSGTVEVRSGKVSSVTYRPTVSGTSEAVRMRNGKIPSTIEFSNYGMPVDVEVPNT